MWIDLEIVIQNEISKKEKNKYCILMNILETGKNSTDESICQVEIETQTQRTNIQTWGGWDQLGD